METLYKLERIEHAGACGERGTERVDGRYPDRKGSIYKINSLYLGYPMILEYVWDNQGMDKSGYLCSTPVLAADICSGKSGEIVVETKNSIYYLKEYRFTDGTEN